MRPVLLVLAVATLSAPQVPRAEDAVAPAPAAAPPTAPAAVSDAVLGEVVLLPGSGSASYTASRVVGPTINFTESEKGTWKGRIRDFDGILEVTEKRISGANFHLVMDRDGEEWVCQGTWDGKRVRIAFAKDGLTVRIQNRFAEMTRVAPDLYATQPVGPALRVKGDAAGSAPLFPQFVLAILAVF